MIHHPPMTEQQVLIHLMLAMAAADEAISDVELSRVERLIDFLPVFENFSPEDLDVITDNFVALMADEEGLDSLMSLLASTLPDDLHETAYALAVEIAAADLTVTPEELHLLDMLRDFLKVDKLAAAAIERGARARFRKIPN
ncbi:hypothetical protein IMCC14465_06310 [alpha proteobacterium IMCC14465]|uniref:Co-chaperone DjlA N-terminal domain-containing protein n=1 Tax=alpha proteobacterium IMCC14465 TaxID=1220535 RepID=J9A3A2_9PROT|nr:hypothetical protein IMCC14465_06310 [alpha proteobacterium IMCC14465]